MANPLEIATPVIHGNSHFTNKLYQLLCKKEGNLLFAPIGIHALLSMVYQGSGSPTTETLSRTLGLPDPKSTAAGYKIVMEYLNNCSPATVLVANKIYAKKSEDKEARFLEEFEKNVKENFYAEVEFADFLLDKTKTVQLINQWVNDKTQKHISEIIDEGFLEEETDKETGKDSRLILINAIYFESEWFDVFDEKLTVNQPFYIDEKNTVQVQMMKIREKWPYTFNKHLSAHIVKIPFENKDLAMIIILPKKKNGIKDLESKLATTNLIEVIDVKDMGNVTLSLPKFKMEASLELEEILKEIGLENIFDEEYANLREIIHLSPLENLCVGKIVQKTFIDVNEKGTIAGAASAGVLRAIPCCYYECPDVTVVVDHPAIFLLTAKQSGLRGQSRFRTEANILFCGRLSHPQY